SAPHARPTWAWGLSCHAAARCRPSFHVDDAASSPIPVRHDTYAQPHAYPDPHPNPSTLVPEDRSNRLAFHNLLIPLSLKQSTQLAEHQSEMRSNAREITSSFAYIRSREIRFLSSS